MTGSKENMFCSLYIDRKFFFDPVKANKETNNRNLKVYLQNKLFR